MSFRFQKRIKLFPGVHLNLSKGGVSLSLGAGPLTLNLGKKSSVTASIPGTGISNKTYLVKK